MLHEQVWFSERFTLAALWKLDWRRERGVRGQGGGYYSGFRDVGSWH